MAAGTTRYIEHAPPGLEPYCPPYQLDSPLRLGIVPVGIKLKVLLAEPFFEPFHGSC
jgi:hypothetical protein